MYRAQRISGHPMSAMRISALAGVRAPVTQRGQRRCTP